MLTLARSAAVPARVRSMENLLVAGVVLLALGVTGIPYLYGYLSAPADRLFLGSVGNPGDANTYLAWMRQAARGEILFANYYSPESTPSEYFNLLWLWLGQLAGMLRLDPALIYQASRLVLGALFLLAAYRFMRVFLKDTRAAWLGFILIALGSGLGWTLRVFEALTHRNLGYGIDYWVPEAFGFFSLLFFPHFLASLICIFGALWCMLRALETDDARYAALAGTSALALALFHLYDVVTVGAVLAVYLGLSAFVWRTLSIRVALRHGLVFGTLTGIGLALYAALALRSPLLSTWAGQNVLPSPGPASYLLGFGLIAFCVPFALARVPTRSAVERGREHLLWVWLVVGFLLVYAPVPFNRRFVEGLQFPIVILGCIGLFRVVVPWLASRFSRLAWRGMSAGSIAIAVMIVFSLPTDLVVMARTLGDLSYHAAGYYLTRSDEQAYEWLDLHAAPGAVVMASETTGNELPRFAAVKVFLGHQQLTYDYAAKKPLLLAFYSTMSDAERRVLISTYKVDYVYWGKREQELGQFNPAGVCYLRPVGQFGATALYAAQPCAMGENSVR